MTLSDEKFDRYDALPETIERERSEYILTTGELESRKLYNDDLSRKELLMKLQNNIPNCYGWTTENNNKDFILNTDAFYTFMGNGFLSIQGDDGEATMWEGNWTLTGDSMNIKYDWYNNQGEEVKTDTTVQVYIFGQNFIMGDRVYKRYCP